jgi:hypothetical protein
MGMMFRILWGVDVVASLIALAFFVIGINDGTVSSFNIMLWIALLAGLAVIVFGSNALQAKGQHGLAFILAAVLAVPALLGCLFFALLLVSGVRWN